MCVFGSQGKGLEHRLEFLFDTHRNLRQTSSSPKNRGKNYFEFEKPEFCSIRISEAWIFLGGDLNFTVRILATWILCYLNQSYLNQIYSTVQKSHLSEIFYMNIILNIYSCLL